MDQIFENVANQAPVEDVITEVDTKGKREKTADEIAEEQELRKSKKDLEALLTSNPELLAQKGSRSGDLEVLKTLGFGKTGNIIVDKVATAKNKAEGVLDEKTGKPKRVLVNTALNVGYIVKNTSKTPIEYAGEEWKLDEATGRYVSVGTTKVIAPGKSAHITRKELGMLGVTLPFMLEFANGRLTKSSKKVASPEEKVEAFYFKFKDVNGNTIEVNSDDIKQPIDNNGDGVIDPKYISTFGYLLNVEEKTKTSGGKTTGGIKVSKQDALAYQLYQELSGGMAK